MSTIQDTEPTVSSSLNSGYRSCVSAVRSLFGESLWTASNLSGEQKTHVAAIGSHLVRCLDLLDLDSADGLSLDVWREIRDELNDSLLGRPTTPELAALCDVVDRYEIPHQFLFDMLRASDWFIRFHKFEAFNDLAAFAANLGGSAMAAVTCVLGNGKPGYEVAAIEAGQAMLLTQLLAHTWRDIKVGKNFLPQEDLDRFDVDVHRLKLRQEPTRMKNMVRFHLSRIEQRLAAGGELIHYLDYDGARSFTSLFRMHDRMLTRMRLDPSVILGDGQVLTRRDQVGLRSRHALGLEGQLVSSAH